MQLLEHKGMESGFDFRQVLNSFSSLSLQQIVRESDIILAQWDAETSAPMRRAEARLVDSIPSFLFFLILGRFSSNRAKQEAWLYRPVIAALVQRNELKRTFLDAVDREITAPLA